MFYERIFRELDRRKIRYMVIGGIAVNIHGYSRATGDLDIMLSFEKNNIKRFIEFVNALGFNPKIRVRIEELGDQEKIKEWKKKKHMKVSEYTRDEYFDVEDLRKYMSLSVEEKLIYLQEINSFLTEAMPSESKKAWEELKKSGW